MSESLKISPQTLLQHAFVTLIETNRYYADLILYSKIHFTTETGTIGINFTDGPNLYINPFFWDSLTNLERVDCLKHEYDHVLKNHFFRWEQISPGIFDDKEHLSYEEKMKHNSLFMQLNVAGDYENNEYLPNLPKSIPYFNEDGTPVIDPETNEPMTGKICLVSDLKQQFPDVEHRKHLEYYYEFLKEKQKDMPTEEKHVTIDDHSMWSKGNKNQEMVKEQIKQLLNKALASSKAAGHTPSDEILKAIHSFNFQTRDWKQDLQRFSAKVAKVNLESTRKVRNRRYGILYPGNRRKLDLTLAIGIDTSASMSDELLHQIHAEIKRIAKSGVDVWIIQCDTEVHEVSQFDEKKPFEFKGRGGTCFKPIFDAADKLDVDGLIVFSDMDNSDIAQVKKPQYDVLWAALEGFTPHYSWGWRTTVKIQRK